jgi:hypothetical protein
VSGEPFGLIQNLDTSGCSWRLELKFSDRLPSPSNKLVSRARDLCYRERKAAAFAQALSVIFDGLKLLDQWPTVFQEMGKLEPVRPSPHLDVGEYQANVASLLKDRNAFIRI